MPYMKKEAKRKEKSPIVPCVSQINNAGEEERSFGMKNLHLIPGGGPLRGSLGGAVPRRASNPDPV